MKSTTMGRYVWTALAAVAAHVFLASASMRPARAEPYFAVREGLKCASCHVNPSGGGMRNAFGNAWAQAHLPARTLETPDVPAWTGTLNRYIAVGGNLRAHAQHVDVSESAGRTEFDIEELRVYLDVAVIPDRLGVYVDQRVAPGGSTNLETYVHYATRDRRWHMRAGQFYLPFGLRIEDDSAFIRQVTGIGFATPDRGVELGFESTLVTAQLAVTNGTAGGPETDESKQISLRAAHVQTWWRAGASFNFNDADAGKRQMQGIFAGVRTGPIAWLAEADYITDDSFAERRRQWVGLLEANWAVINGHNLKLTAELFEPDTDVDEDEQNRFSAVWEYTPIQFVQLRVGARIYDGIPQNALQNRRIYFAGINGFF